jgi:hypothetical protein
MASPLFSTVNRPKNPASLSDRDLRSLWAGEPPFIVSVERTPGLFLLAEQALVNDENVPQLPASWWIKLEVPSKWDKPKIHLLPCAMDAEVRNGSQIARIKHAGLVIRILAQAFAEAGCETSVGPPSRFERADII